MFKNYIATEEDLKTIEEGISYVWKPELDYIFKDKSRIEDITIISYDSKHMYLFGHNKKMEKVEHNVEIGDFYWMGWCAGMGPEELMPYLPERFSKYSYNDNDFAVISGALLTPMIEEQKKSERRFNAYTTKESYLATIVHEFGHAYFNSFNLHYFSDLKNNLSCMDSAFELFKGNKLSEPISQVQFPLHEAITEVFAFCTDYSAASIFWPEHKKDIDNMNVAEIEKIRERERKLDLSKENSYFSDDRYGSHLVAAVAGKLLLNRHPKDWTEKILRMNRL